MLVNLSKFLKPFLQTGRNITTFPSLAMCVQLLVNKWGCNCNFEPSHVQSDENRDDFILVCQLAAQGGLMCATIQHLESAEAIPWFCPKHHFEMINKSLGPLYVAAAQVRTTTMSRINELPSEVVSADVLAGRNQLEFDMQGIESLIMDSARQLHRMRDKAIKQFFGQDIYDAYWHTKAARDRDKPLGQYPTSFSCVYDRAKAIVNSINHENISLGIVGGTKDDSSGSTNHKFHDAMSNGLTEQRKGLRQPLNRQISHAADIAQVSEGQPSRNPSNLRRPRRFRRSGRSRRRRKRLQQDNSQVCPWSNRYRPAPR